MKKLILHCALLLVAPVWGDVVVTLDPSLKPANNSGRLVLYFRVQGDENAEQKQKLRGLTEVIGVDVPDIASTREIRIDSTSSGYPVSLSDLPEGKYLIEAVLDHQHLDSNWRREPGNLYSLPRGFEVAKGKQIDLKLTSITKDDPLPKVEGVEWFELRSKLLSDFRGRDVTMRAGILLPANYDPTKKYAAVYEIPGFGGNHTYAAMAMGKRRSDPHRVSRPDNVFWIILDPEGPNGHTLFCDSDNNGPCGRSLVEEFIPAIEEKYPLIRKPEARMVRGHSSGGWSSLWLTLNYPETFGTCFSTSPDPVDFRKLEKINLYQDENAYTDSAGHDFPAMRNSSVTVRDENSREEILGPDNSSADQWDSWQACWGHRLANGHVAPLFDPKTGKIDRAEAESYCRFDIVELVRRNPEKFEPIFRDHVRLVVGDADNFFLNEAVELLQKELNGTGAGYIKFAAGKDHGTVHLSDEVREMVEEMRQIGERKFE